METLQQNSITDKQRFRYIQGDLSSIDKAWTLARTLNNEATQYGLFDSFIQTAAVFPDWSQPLLQEDGFDKAFIVFVVGKMHSVLQHGNSTF